MKERDVGRRYNIENKIFVKERLRNEKTMMMLVMAIICMMCMVGCGSHTCAKCGKTFTGTSYRNVMYEGGGVLCEDCAGYAYGADMSLYEN